MKSIIAVSIALFAAITSAENPVLRFINSNEKAFVFTDVTVEIGIKTGLKRYLQGSAIDFDGRYLAQSFHLLWESRAYMCTITFPDKPEIAYTVHSKNRYAAFSEDYTDIDLATAEIKCDHSEYM
ncbi:unnamed protein product [Diplocarpon coronariae]